MNDKIINIIKLIRNAKSDEEGEKVLLDNIDKLLETEEVKSRYSYYDFPMEDKTIIKKYSKYAEEILDKELKRQEDVENMISSTDYIEWLIEFTKNNNNSFYTNDWDYKPEEITAEDMENIKKISTLLDVINDYVEEIKCSYGYYYKIKHHDEVLNIGVVHGQEVEIFVNLISKQDEAGNIKLGYDAGSTEYSEIIRKYKKYHGIEEPKQYKKD